MAAPSNVAIAARVDAGSGAGLGHLMRSTALAAVLRRRQPAAPRFLLRGDDAAAALLAAQRFLVERVDDDGAGAIESWAATSPGRARLVIIDMPAPPPALLGSARRAATVLAGFMDGRAWPAAWDVAIHGSVYWPSVDWTPLPAGARRCFGPEFLCLRPNLVAQRRVPRPLRHPPQRLLVTMGGSDPFGATPRVLAAIAAVAGTRPVPPVDVVIGPDFRDTDTIASAAAALGAGAAAAMAGSAGTSRSAGSGPACSIHHHLDDLGPLMGAADLAISAGGHTLYELALLGTPAIAIPQTADEVLNASALDIAGTCLALPRDRPAWEAALPGAIESLLGDPVRRAAMSRAGQRLVDGQGAGRVADVLLGLARDRHIASPNAG